ncbi:MAG TPA: hypothetical protein VIZ68_01065, partial [Thermoplasmata archaeon]
MFSLISLLLATLTLGTVATFLSGERARWVALATSIAFLGEVSSLLAGFPNVAGSAGTPQFAAGESVPWISISWLHVNYTVGLDGISLVL